MPPRIHRSLPNIASALTPYPQSKTSPAVASKCPLHGRKHDLSRTFSTTPSQPTRQRNEMWTWLNGPGVVFRQPLEGSTNYLGAYDKSGRLIRGSQSRSQERKEREAQDEDDAPAREGEARGSQDGASANKSGRERAGRQTGIPPETKEDLQPFPLNPFFRSEAVLSEDLRNEVFRRVTEQGHTVRQVSQDLSVDMSRVGAVVRLKTVEQDWLKKDKPLAKPYARAILGMLPQTPLTAPNAGQVRHEAINVLPVHPSTTAQIFHPTSESRHFTRADAGKVFARDLLPAEDRIPHPDMIQHQRDRTALGPAQAERERVNRLQEEVEEAKKQKEEARKREESKTTVVSGPRWDFRVRDFGVEENLGVEGARSWGRSSGSRKVRDVGWRYGFPREDRKKGRVKIPTRVE